MKTPRAATVVLPAYDVADVIAPIVKDLTVAAYALKSRGIDLELLMLDGGTDDAASLAEEAAAGSLLNVRVFAGPPAGSGPAYVQGFRLVVEEGRSELVVTLDANGRHDPTQIPRLVDHLIDRGLHVVIGSRWVRGSGTPGLSFRRWLLGRAANGAFRLLTSTRGISDATTSFRVARIEAIRDFDPGIVPVNSHSVQTAFVALSMARGYRVGEAPIIYRPPLKGGGELRGDHIREFAGHLWRLRKQVLSMRTHRLSAAGRSFDDEHFAADDDLERLGTSKHFFDWVLDDFEPALKGRLLEVGAGTGTITRRLIERHPDMSVVALEPADNMFRELEPYAALTDRVEALKTTLGEYLESSSDRFDTVIYVNVLEHIERDEDELQSAAAALVSGGALLVFGPALEWLYSELDYKAGHYRRYSLDRLRRITEGVGLQIERLYYFDILGVAPYFLVYRLIRRSSISGSTMWGYDRVVVPTSRALQRMIASPPIGKNFLLIARRP